VDLRAIGLARRAWRARTGAADPATAATALLYLHVPKTAGTAVRHLLERHYSSSERVYLYTQAPGMTQSAFLAQPEQARATARLVYGHFQYGLHESLPQASRYVTMLRHPADRVASLYHHYRTRHHRFRDAIASGAMSLDDFVRSGMALGVDNGMVRQIGGVRRTPFGQLTRAHLELAMDHIRESFAAVLIQELMEPSMAVLSGVVGASLGLPRRENVSVRAELEPESRTLIEHVNALDLELYHWARHRLLEAAARAS
jgi:hypothetical protein